MDFNFDWNCVSAGAPYITISETGLGFNAPASAMLGNPERVAVGFDERNMIIGVKVYDESMDAKGYPFYSRMKNGWVRIGCRDFIKYLSSLSGEKFSPSVRYIAQFEREEQLLYIHVCKKADQS